MKKNATLVLWAMLPLTILLLILRFVELSPMGFDPVTGITLHNIWNILPPVVFLAAALLAFLLTGKLPKEKRPFREAFAVPGSGETMCAVLGGLLMAAGGAYSAVTFVAEEGGIIAVVTGALSALSGLSVILMVRSIRREDKELSVAPLLPVLFFTVFLALMAYLPAGTDPILSRYWLRVLAAALLACSFSLLAGFFKKESSPRLFVPVAVLSAVCAVCAIPGLSLHMVGMYAGMALVILAFVLPCLRGGAEPVHDDGQEEP